MKEDGTKTLREHLNDNKIAKYGFGVALLSVAVEYIGLFTDNDTMLIGGIATGMGSLAVAIGSYGFRPNPQANESQPDRRNIV